MLSVKRPFQKLRGAETRPFEADCHSANHDISSLLLDAKVHYSVHKNPPLDLILRDIKHVHSYKSKAVPPHAMQTLTGRESKLLLILT